MVIDAIELRIFLPHPSSPARRGSTSPSAPSPQERAPTGKPAVLYSQTSSRPFGAARRVLTQQKVTFVDSRLRSAEHSSELDALLSLARELRVFDAHSAIFWRIGQIAG